MSSGGTLLWAGLVVVGVILIAPGLDRTEAPTTAAETSPAAEGSSKRAPGPPATAPAGNGLATQELVRGPDGHFYAEAQVNGAPVRFMVDTGATVVALTREDAQRAGILFGTERAVARGVGGDVEVIPVTIDRLAIGPLQTTQIRAAVVDDLDVSLLGQSFLSRVGSVEIRDDRMVLR